jgi:hypothetical protein
VRLGTQVSADQGCNAWPSFRFDREKRECSCCPFSGALGYRFLTEFYACFPFDAEQMPYADRAQLPFRIDPLQLVSGT